MDKILAVDDKKDNLVALSAFIRNLMPGCTMVTAQSGMEGIGKAVTESPDVILLDVVMPDIDGFETCRRLKADERTKHIPVIMITAVRTDPKTRVKGLEMGADAFLNKPIDEYELVSQVKVALRIKKAEDSLRRERDSLEQIVEERTVSLKEEIANRRLVEEALRSSLNEKEALLKEVQHRVKNNLLTIHSILALQLDRIKDGESKGAFIATMNRINAIAKVHARLYQSENYSLVDFKKYVEEFLRELSRSYRFPPENLKIDISDIAIDINSAIPAGLIVNELVSNAMKHAFPEGREGTITVGLYRKDGKLCLMVRDGGTGFPEEVDFTNTGLLGLQLVVNLAEQLDGTVELKRDNGTELTITFPYGDDQHE